MFAILISLSVSTVVYFYSKEIATQINARTLYRTIQISSFILFFSSINSIQNGILAGIQNFKVLSINNTIAGVISAFAMVVASIIFNLNTVVIAFGVSFVILFILNFISLK